MNLKIMKGDITALTCDAIVNAANRNLRGGGGVDGAIHRVAGKQLDAECRAIGICKTGEACITRGYNLPSRYVIHTVGPVWHGGAYDEEKQLKSCYRSALKIAAAQGFTTVAFPLISGGVYGYPKRDAVRIALSEMAAYCRQHPEAELTLVLFGDEEYRIAAAEYPSICG